MIIWRKIIECNFGKLIYRKKRYKKTVKEIEEERGRLTRTNDWCFIELQEEESSEKAVRVKERGRLKRTNDWCFIELQEEESSEKAVRVKELEEERGRLTRTNDWCFIELQEEESSEKAVRVKEERGRLTRTNDWCFIELQEEESSEKAVRVKELEEERGRLTRTNAAQTTQIDKFKKLAEDCKSKADSLETQLTATKKVHIVLVELLKF